MKIEKECNGIRLLSSIDSLADYESDGPAARKPVLVGCLHRHCDYQKQIEALQKMSESFGEQLDIFLLTIPTLKVFMEKYRVLGTPTFLILVAGKEQGRLLGQSKSEDLRDFVLQTLPGFHQ